jgi:hypothetical protein
MDCSHTLHLIVLALVSLRETATARTFFRTTENSGAAIAGNDLPIMHTGSAFNPTAQEAARQNHCLSRGQHIREDDNAL